MSRVTDPTSMPSFGAVPGAPPRDGNALRGRVFDALQQEGYRPGIDEDGDVAFRAQGHQLFVQCLDSVPPLVRVMGQWLERDVPGGELIRLRAANAVVGAMNLIKVTVVDDVVVVAVDFIVTDGLDLRPLLHPTVEAVIESMQAWRAAAHEYGGEFAAPDPAYPDGGY